MPYKFDANGNIVTKEVTPAGASAPIKLPVFALEDGTEVEVDYETTRKNLTRVNGEAAEARHRINDLSTKLKSFEGITDPEAARAALQTVADIETGELIKAGEVEKVRTAAKEAAEAQVAQARKADSEKINALTQERDTFKSKFSNFALSNAFATSKFIPEKCMIPASFIKSTLSDHFGVDEDGRVFAYNEDKSDKMWSEREAGSLASVDEALERIISKHPDRDSILKGTNQSGAGSGGSGKGTGSGIDPNLPPAQRLAMARAQGAHR